jgi:CRISPR/Cas system-associated exonuclease Cas4 (RecB family)
MFNPIDYYVRKLEQDRNDYRIDNPKLDNYYRVSSAGTCARKQYYHAIKKAEETNPMEDSSRMLLRLGELVHQDIQEGVLAYRGISGIKQILHEHPVELSELNVKGRLDMVIIMNTGEVYLYDFKTISSWGYRSKFGRKNNREANPSIHQEMQLATYGLAVRKEFGRLDGMSLIFYNKDNSKTKMIEVDIDYIDIAIDYWSKVKELHESGLPNIQEGESPVMKWECNKKYCSYYDLCGGGLNSG